MIDFDIAKTLLKEFALHVEYFVRGIEESKLDPETVLDDKKCNLGEWLQGDGRRYASLPAYGNLIRKHREFHQVAGAIISKFRAGNLNADHRPQISLLRESTEAVIDAIDRLETSALSYTTLVGSSRNTRREKILDISNWRTGVPVESKLIDDQHKMLLRLVEKLNSQPDALTSSELFRDAKLALDQILILHFETEERIMVGVQYPHQARQEHINEHHRLLGLSVEIDSDLGQIKYKFASEVYQVIKPEVLNHIDQYDTDLSSYLFGVS